ncbi:MAG: hypothetical protein PHD05_06190 [Sphaerochaetaceae bacterium]|nr:hypothetical protein [Sphaerochaetaceae bacterium]
MKHIKKSLLITVLIILVCLTPLMAKSSLAQKTDGTIVVLNEDNKTYEPFVEKTYDVPTGYKLNSTGDLNFMGLNWDEGSLTALGNYVQGSYTTGEFYLLELKKSFDSKSVNFDRTYPSPIIKLSDGTELKGYYENIAAYSSFSNYRNLVGINQTKTLTYTLRFDVPKDKEPVSLVFKDVNNQNPIETKLGTKIEL